MSTRKAKFTTQQIPHTITDRGEHRKRWRYAVHPVGASVFATALYDTLEEAEAACAKYSEPVRSLSIKLDVPGLGEALARKLAAPPVQP